MFKRYFSLFIVLTLLVVTTMLWLRAGESGLEQHTQVPASSREFQTDASPRTVNLEFEIDRLNRRVERLEAQVRELEPQSYRDGDNSGNATFPDTRITDVAPEAQSLNVIDALVKSGLDSYTAEEIAQKQSEVELKRLELRDDAIREGYIGTQRYRDELAALQQEQVNVRDEIDDAAFDKYLYYTGQSNRIEVTSVILGSAAERGGIQAGDMILRYEDEPLYNGRDLRTATSMGQRDELVDITVQRGDTLITVSAPRGPLGVRLNPLSIDPEPDQ